MNPSKSFPIEQSYINLAIVKAKEQHAIENQLRDTQHATAVLGTFEAIYGMKTTIDVKNIFETCKNHEKRVLVFGRAGIGKSTFCQYIAYQWATGSYWPQYELLALIPLRRLTAQCYPPLPHGQSYSLIDLVKKEVLRHNLTGKEEELLKKQFDERKTLWILDGYDEIVHNVPPHLQCLFDQLLETPHHILTSRPYLNTLSYDVQMEITGFTDEDITEYVEQFFDQMKDELDDAMIKSVRLLNFLKSNQSIWGVVHIPVNLELICSLWSNEDWSETEQLKITMLYTKMTEWLCRRYLRTHENQFQQLLQTEIDQCCQKELAFLESLAFHAMESNTIIIQSSILKKALNEAKVSSQAHPHILNMGILKSVNKQGIGNRIETDKDHYFVHLSFQEYFAARYLITALTGSQTEKAIKFIKYQKYNQRYTLVFTFAAGLLSESDAQPSLEVFWNHLLGEPLDLVGIRQMELVILCMEETTDKSTLFRRSELLEWIAKCIRYSLTNKKEAIRRHLSQSLQRAPSVVCDPTTHVNIF
jgi:predicted NACHT family NTPase